MFNAFLRNPTGGLNQTGQPDNGNQQGSWIFNTIARGVATLAGLLAILFGILSILTLQILVGALLCLEGFTMTLIESPCFFVYLDFAHIPSRFFDNKPHWYRAVTYLVFGILPVFKDHSISVAFSSCLMVAASGAYLVLSLGKKASLDEMRAKAGANISENPSAVLVNNEAAIDRSGPPVFTPPVALGDMRQSVPNPSKNSVMTY